MKFSFTVSDIQRITETLGTSALVDKDEYSFRLTNEATRQSLTLTLYNNVGLGKGVKGALVVAQTQHGYFELHSCSGFMVFEPDEIIFIGVAGDYISSMVVGKQCTCSMFTNIRREILSADFSKLDSRVLMSAMQLSLTEMMLTA